MSSSKVRIQLYLKRNRVSELFEEMMSKLIQDLPSEPVQYLVHYLERRLTTNKKLASKEVTNLRSKSLKASSLKSGLWSDTKQEHGSAEKLTSSAEFDGRHYSKPWLSNSKKDKSPLKDKNKEVLSQTSPADLNFQVNKDGFLGVDGKKPADEKDFESSGTKVYGRRPEVSDSGNNEFSCKDVAAQERKETRRGKSLSAKDAKKLRRKQLKESVSKSSKNKENRSKNDVISDDDDDDAVELYENAEELYEEGVKNPPKTGIYTSGRIPHQKEQIELVLNMSKFFDSLGGAVSVSSYNNRTSVDDDNEEFESASQVTGPRRPVWEAPDSEVESVASKHQLMASRRINISIFDVKSSSEQKSPSKPASVVKAGSALSKSAEKPKRKTPSQVSNASRRSLEANKSPLNKSEELSRRKGSTKDTAQERPKTAQ